MGSHIKDSQSHVVATTWTPQVCKWPRTSKSSPEGHSFTYFLGVQLVEPSLGLMASIGLE